MIQVISSKMKPENGYGQNGASGASSDLPGQHTTSGFLPQCKAPAPCDQTRDVGPGNVPVHPGMHKR
jgi:hypothetical protein